MFYLVSRFDTIDNKLQRTPIGFVEAIDLTDAAKKLNLTVTCVESQEPNSPRIEQTAEEGDYELMMICELTMEKQLEQRAVA